MFVHKGQPEITIPVSSAGVSSMSGEGGEMATAAPGRKLLRCIIVSFGLLCVLQAALNICLRLALYSTPGIDASCKNLTEERDTFASQLNSVTEERDELRRKLDVSTSQLNSVTEERDELKRKLNVYTSQLNLMTEERDELKRKLNVYNHYLDQEWVFFDGSFYLSSSIKKTWQDSREDCLQRGADLIIIDSKQEQEFTRRFQGKMWIGLTDRETEGEWKWVDDTLLTTSFWYSGEPNNFRNRNEDCVETYSNYLNSWNDAVCENENLWICEKGTDL